ncbi:hypothetical protein [Roseivivax marinus]|uniref:hypothetical protein n=1 Tax=Roseivivax marinus TaxID=1379903 RepID=UPI00273DE227|nr:hypothetical protein [Roseivivax marinus]
MALKPTHGLHDRRYGRNLGVGLTLAAFIAVIFGLTVVKVTRGDFESPRAATSASGTAAETEDTQ